MPRPPPPGSGRHWWEVYTFIPLAVLIAAIAGALVLWAQDKELAEANAQRTFFHQAQRIRAIVEGRITRTEDLLRAAAAEFGSPQAISGLRWSHFIEAIDVRRNYPGLVGIGYVAYVRHEGLPLFTALRQTETNGFGVFPLGRRDDYMINTYIEPAAPLARIIGYDVGSDLTRRLTLERARDKGQLAVTPKLELIGPGNILMYLPIYRHGLPTATVEERRAAIQGWAVASLVVADLMAGIVGPNEAIDLEIYDGEPSLDSLFLDADNTPAARQGDFARRNAQWSGMEVGGRTWTLFIAPTIPSLPSSGRPDLILVIGCVMAFLLWWGTHLTMTRHLRMERQAVSLSQELSEKEERLRLVLEYSHDAFWDWNMVDDTVFYATHVSSMLGYEPDEIPSNSEGLRMLLHPNDREDVHRRFLSLLKSDQTRIEHEYRLREKNGEFRWLHEIAAVVERVDGRVTRMVGTITDATQRHRSEDFLRLLSTVVEQSPMAVVITDDAATIEYVNPRFVTLTGYTADEILGHNPSLIKSGLTPAATYQAMWSTIKSGQEWRGEILNRKKGGELYWEDTVITPVRNSEGAVFYVAVKEDVTERKRIEQEMQELAKLPEQSPDPILRLGRDGDILYANQSGRVLFAQNSDLSVEWRITMLSCLYSGTSKELELTLDERSFSFLFVPVMLSNYVNVYGRDITKRRKAEERLRQGQKMEAIGTLAGGIAHDFNNILTSILGYNNLILGDSGDPEALADDVRQIHTAATRAKDLVRQILTFSRVTQTDKEPMNLRRIIEETLPLVRATTPKTVDIQVDLGDGEPTILCTPVQIHQLLINLCGNAVDAFESHKGNIAIRLEPGGSGWLRLSVADDGCGIPASIRSRIFDPFFTTKPTGKGTGLGLAVVHGIVEDLGGRITVESVPGGGTRFVIDLPEADGAPMAGDQDDDDAFAPVSRTASILVVDDEAPIAGMLQRFFRRQGHRVHAAASGQEALELIREGKAFDVIVSDQMMPDVSGTDLAHAVRKHCPGTRVILCSGRDDLVSPEMCRSAGIAAFLVKPLNMIELTDTVSRVLGPQESDIPEVGGVKA
ncbi:multi-sensor hybrid histidine kinase [Paramagnetospirillum caucaseum]|uniref:histidine kinase n=1 Tax=Paramagnetospirillum caucaseum TaxID=1244869 RepID=M2ZMK8_9PROT|nr:PAS domain S-box protein [Paramagnetospirillum caucaseum]EME68527.1 multi-sensor hybrid histidine kinase [Paramagnetospirillum caucaseum]